ncbi:MAG: anthranilate synthase component I family protein [Polyangiales bacterium]
MPTKTVVFDDLTPASAYAALRAHDAGKPSFLLESAPNAGERWGRYSILGWRPRRRISVDLLEGARAVRVISEPLRGAGERVEVRGASRDVLSMLREHVLSGPSRPVAPGTPRVVDGAVGYVAYDLVHALEPIGPWTEERRVACFLDGATTVVFDARLQTVTIQGDDDDDVEETIRALEGRSRLRPMQLPSRGAAPSQITPSMDDATYQAIVRRAKTYIEAGDVFQVVLARTFTSPRGNADPFDAYRAMRVLNASPYLYFLELGDLSIAGASPETLVRLEDGIITVRPLAGTRPRGETEERDLQLERELLADPKERAEHVMLVDLGRNDVGRVAKIGSVRVPVQMSIERYSHVMHLVSEVHGELAEGKDAWDVLAAAFPAGTLSGAPKVRAMQIIRELEQRPRGIYGGAIGYVSRHGTMDLAIAIRTIVAYADRFEVGAGAGVVEASDPALEAAETRHKASAALAAIAAAQQMAAK